MQQRPVVSKENTSTCIVIFYSSISIRKVKFINFFRLKEKPSGCGSDLGCYSDCDSTCKFVVTWKDNGNNVDFTLAFTLESGGSDQWIALGLSDDQKMV